MKKLVVLAVLILALSSSFAMAVSNSWTVDLAVNSGVTTSVAKDFVLAQNLYVFTFDGTWGITGTGNGFNYIKGTLDSTLGSQASNAVPTSSDWLYKFFITNDSGSTWQEVGKLFQGTVYAGTNVMTASLTGTSVAYNANGMRVLYGVNAGVAGQDTANGLLSMTAKAVPEASTLVGFGSALAMAGPGLVGWLRRRRS